MFSAATVKKTDANRFRWGRLANTTRTALPKTIMLARRPYLKRFPNPNPQSPHSRPRPLRRTTVLSPTLTPTRRCERRPTRSAARLGMQKAIRLGLAVDESLTTSHIGAYINYRTAAYWLADDKGAGTVDLSQEASAKGAAAKAAKANQAASRPRARSASNCYTSNVAETLHGVAEEAIGSAASAVSRLRPGALAYDPNAAQAYDADTHPSRWTDERLRAYLRDAPGSHASVAARRNRIQSREQLVRPLALTLTHNPSPIPNPNPNPGPNQVRYACDAMRRAPPRAPPAADAAAAAAAADAAADAARRRAAMVRALAESAPQLPTLPRAQPQP